MGILNQNFQISNLKSIFKPIRKLSHFFPKIKKITLGVLKVCKVSVKSKNIFGTHPSPIRPSVTQVGAGAWNPGAGMLGLHMEKDYQI